MAKNKTLRDHAGELAESLTPAVETARELAGPYVADARDKAAPLVSDARDRVAPLLDEARDRVVPVLVSARDLAVPYLADVRDVAAPYVATARDKATPLVSDARDRVSGTFTSEVLPVVAAALAALDDATEDARHETAKRGRALAAALRGEIEARAEEPVVDTSTASGSSHWLRTVLVALGLGGAGFAVVKRLNSKQQADSWQSSYTPPATTTPSTPPSTTTPLADAAADSVADDAAASDPGEAVADATDTPHVATTPDNPVTEIDVDKR
jgi:hypothetical protein